MSGELYAADDFSAGQSCECCDVASPLQRTADDADLQLFYQEDVREHMTLPRFSHRMTLEMHVVRFYSQSAFDEMIRQLQTPEDRASGRPEEERINWRAVQQNCVPIIDAVNTKAAATGSDRRLAGTGRGTRYVLKWSPADFWTIVWESVEDGRINWKRVDLICGDLLREWTEEDSRFQEDTPALPPLPLK